MEVRTVNNIEKDLEYERKNIQQLKAPEHFEAQVRKTLEGKKKKRNRSIVWKAASIIFIFTILFGYNFNAVAYYSKKILGFEEVETTTLKQLNDEEMGQLIDKKIELQDGTTFTIDGIISDANRLVMYYTLMNENGLDEMGHPHFHPYKITGFLTDSTVISGTSLLSDDETEVKGVMDFEAVSPFAKKLTLHYSDKGGYIETNEGTVTFPYNPNEALQTIFKRSINKKVKVDKGTITFESIVATPTMTIVNGKMNVENFDRIPYGFNGIQLEADGKEIGAIGAGITSSLFGSEIEVKFDVIPKDSQTLELKLHEFVGYHVVDKTITLANVNDTPIDIGNKKLWIKEITKFDDKVEMRIATEENVLLDGVYLQADDVSVPVLTTKQQIETEDEDGQIWKERTIIFETTMTPISLQIEGLHYVKEYKETIHIPVK